MPHDPFKDNPPYKTDEAARRGALDFIRSLGGVIGRLMPHRSEGVYNDEGQRIGVRYQTTRGRTVTIRHDTNPTPSETQRGITKSYDVRVRGEKSRHFSSTQVRRRRGSQS